MDGRIVEPAELAGTMLMKLRPWIDTLDPQRQEEARVLRWGTMAANGRTASIEDQSDATRMQSGSCYTFQPHNAVNARRVGQIRDFSTGAAHPLDKRAAVS